MQKKKLRYIDSLRPLLQDLRWAAHNPNVIGATPGQVMTSKADGWEFGCKVEDHDLFMRRKVHIKAEQPLHTIPAREKDPVVNTVMDEMLDQGTPATSIEVIAKDCIMIVQDFVPILLQKTGTARGHIKINDQVLGEAGRIIY
jgi:hypothetical protein